MIDLSSLVKVIQEASLSAVKSVSYEHLKILSYYFEPAEDIEETDTQKRKKSNTRKSFINLFTQSADGSNDEFSDRLKPKMVTIQYPQETVDGIEVHDVHVPLLTLMPISMPQISELRFTSELELSLDENDALQVSFPSKRKERKFLKNSDPQENTSTAKLEIVFNDSNLSDGLQKIIEGYEKALRAQIPG